MSQFEIRPQEIYLLERYSSAEYFKAMLDSYANMVAAAEKALDIFMQDLRITIVTNLFRNSQM